MVLSQMVLHMDCYSHPAGLVHLCDKLFEL